MTPTIFMPFAGGHYEKDGVKCRLEDLVMLTGSAGYDYDQSGRCLGLWAGDGSTVALKPGWNEWRAVNVRLAEIPQK